MRRQLRCSVGGRVEALWVGPRLQVGLRTAAGGVVLLNFGDLRALGEDRLLYSLANKTAFVQWLDVPAAEPGWSGLAVLDRDTLALYTLGRGTGLALETAALADLKLEFACSKLASGSPLVGRLTFELLLAGPPGLAQNTRVRIELRFESRWRRRVTLALLLAAGALLVVLLTVLVFFLFYVFRRTKRLEHYDRAIDFWVFQYSQDRVPGNN